MEVTDLTEITAIQDLLASANLPEDSRQTALWCLRQLPDLYRELARTYDSRHGDEILRLTRAVFHKAAGSSVGDAVREQLIGLHERLGFGTLELRVPRPPARRARKVG